MNKAPRSRIFLCVLLWSMPLLGMAQVPQNPNTTDENGLRQGTWTILYNVEWGQTEIEDSAAFYRIISYNNDIPDGIVRDYYLSGQVQWEATLLQDRPDEIYDGEVVYYREDGTVELSRLYVKGEIVSEEKFDLAGHEIAISWQELNGQLNWERGQGNYEKATHLGIQALEECELQFGFEHLNYSIALHSLATLCAEQGAHESALPLYIRALETCQDIKGVGHGDCDIYLNDLALSYTITGDFENGLLHYTTAMQNCKKMYGEEHYEYAIRLNNLGQVYQSLYDFDQAFELYTTALEILKHHKVEQLSTYALVVLNLGTINLLKREYEKALPLCMEALELIRNTFGETHSFYGTSLNNLALVHKKMGEFDKALPLYLEALENCKVTKGEYQYEYGLCLNNLALLHRSMSNFEMALSLCEQAVDVWENSLGQEHFTHGVHLTSLAVLYYQMGYFTEAYSYFMESSEITRASLDGLMAFTSENQQIQFLTKVEENYETIRSLAASIGQEVPEIFGLTFDNVLGQKERMLIYAMLKKRSVATLGVEDKLFAQELAKLRETIYFLELSPSEIDVENLRNLKSKAEELDRHLAKSSSAYREAHLKSRTTWQDVRSALKENEMAIEFVHFRNYNIEVEDSVWGDSTYYAALVLRKNVEQPKLIPLFEEHELESLISISDGLDKPHVDGLYARRGIKRVNSNANQFAARSEIYNLIWKPLEPHLDGIETISFAPSGILNVVAFSALATKNGPLGNEVNLRQVSSTAKIVHENDEPDKKSTISVYSGVYYNYDSEDAEVSRECFLYGVDQDPSDENKVQKDSWDFLNGAEKEGKAIASKFAKGQSSLVTGKAATEQSIKSLSGNSPAILHIASHAFFFPDAVDTTSKDLFSEPVFKRSEDPLMRSGLIMAGANYAWQHGNNPYEEEDGILTAYEISHLDLEKTDLVVLSACETGLGEVQGSEGVFGLQRAFKMAGVDYIIMSLWKVPDEPTREFMELFYDNWLGGLPIREAFRNTQRTMCQKYDPYEWAAFVLVD